MAHRKVKGLRWAKELSARPGYIPIGRARGQKAFGTRYEKSLERELGGGWRRGVWFEFEDSHGLGCCQVDFLGDYGRLWVLEAKYTWTLEGHEQMEELYGPIVAKARDVSEASIGKVLVCKNLTVSTRRKTSVIVENLEHAMAIHAARGRVVLQWLPGTGIRAPRLRGTFPDHRDVA